MPSASKVAYRHTVRIRYGEVDQQGVVFNAHYMAYIDDALENWLEDAAQLRLEHGWDMMLKTLSIEWQGSAANGERLDIDVAPIRYGRTSWEVGYAGTCQERAVFTARVVYISVALGRNEPIETPRAIREYMGEVVEWGELVGE